ncbi:unnamed protein product [Thelazia callipaeda]|uniref:DUF4139 domain-containing protein n=1 Tax=Thelazia callipaeda TaxID=103827 RepID=A0A0N5D0G0_THECL|nr:unnamed protein product [Thelazia callipaeda]
MKFCRNVCVTLESQENCEVDLSITYQVSNASWHPSYEIRVESDANTLKLLCFGNINQNTGEDWINASINLSTSKPIIGGVLPKLGTLVAEFFKPEPVPQFAAFAQPCAARTKPRAVTYAESSMSTTFTIPNRKSIMSNTTDHKLLMTSVILDTTMCYECIPSKSTNVYLTAYVINDSSVPFLAGQAAIYVDNCFVGKHTFNAVSPGERFKCLLTIDPAIKVEYKPVNKYTEQVGLITKSVTTMHERTVVIKNTKSSSVLVIIRENIPKSTDEKIKIKLYSPELDSKDEREFLVPTIGARLDVDHNLECVQKIESNDKKELLIKWSTEHPKEETVNFREVFSHGNS